MRDRAFLPGPPDVWVGAWVGVAATPISCRDILVWPFSVGLLVNMVLPFSILYIGLRMGAALVWVVCPMLSCSFCMKFRRVRERLELEKAVPGYRRPGRCGIFSVELFVLVHGH